MSKKSRFNVEELPMKGEALGAKAGRWSVLWIVAILKLILGLGKGVASGVSDSFSSKDDDNEK